MSEFRVQGVQPVLEALRLSDRVMRIWLARESNATSQRLMEAARSAGVPVRRVPREALERMAEPRTRHQGVVAELRQEALRMLELGDLIARLDPPGTALVLLLDGIQDPGNLGAILRSAAALGADGVIVPQDRSAALGPTVVKRSAGAALHVPLVRVVNLKHALPALEEAGLWTAAAVLDGAPAPEVDLDRPLALVVGGEHRGVRPSLARRCQMQISIPMGGGLDSLNAAVAAGILLYETQRQRGIRREEGKP